VGGEAARLGLVAAAQAISTTVLKGEAKSREQHIDPPDRW
jgi:hypothetical protein